MIAFDFKSRSKFLLTKVREQKQVIHMFAPHVSGANIFFLHLLLSRYIREKKQIGDYCYVTVIHTANSATTSANALSNP